MLCETSEPIVEWSVGPQATNLHIEECSVLCLGLTFCPKVYSFQGVDCQICEMACGRGRRRQGKRYLTRLTSHQPFHLKRASVRGISDRAMNKPVVHTFFLQNHNLLKNLHCLKHNFHRYKVNFRCIQIFTKEYHRAIRV